MAGRSSPPGGGPRAVRLRWMKRRPVARRSPLHRIATPGGLPPVLRAAILVVSGLLRFVRPGASGTRKGVGRMPAVRAESRPLHIAQVAPLYESVPPPRYGGTERIVSHLTEE